MLAFCASVRTHRRSLFQSAAQHEQAIHRLAVELVLPGDNMLVILSFLQCNSLGIADQLVPNKEIRMQKLILALLAGVTAMSAVHAQGPYVGLGEPPTFVSP